MKIYTVLVTQDYLEFKIVVMAKNSKDISDLVKEQMLKEGYGLKYKMINFEEVNLNNEKIVSFSVTDKEYK